MEKTKEYKNIILFILVIILGVFFIAQNQIFSVKLKNCDTFYKDCFVAAKFKDFDNCKTIEERYNWYCDSTDKNNISCRESKAGESFRLNICTK